MAAGRPRIWDDPDELEKACDGYFNDENLKPTVTGLALHLGFDSKQSLYDYRDRPEFSYPIKKALTLIEKYHEEGLSENNVAGRIFALKNMGWKDKAEIEHSGTATPIQIIFPADDTDPGASTTNPG